jgi:hypothetical protein
LLSACLWSLSVNVSFSPSAQDRHIRVLDGTQLYFEALVDGAVTALAGVKDPEEVSAVPRTDAERTEVVYGTDSGVVGKMLLSAKAIRPEWAMPNVGNLGGVTALATADLNKKVRGTPPPPLVLSGHAASLTPY